MKKAAFAVWMNRIAPVMDVAGTVCLVESDGATIPGRMLFKLPSEHPSALAMFLKRIDARVLVCGAVSNGLLRLLNSQGIEVVPFVAGDLETVIGAWLKGRLPDRALMMPGCRIGRPGHGCGGSGKRMKGEVCCCVCARCGHREAHVRGIPCVQRRCPECGTAMRRE